MAVFSFIPLDWEAPTSVSSRWHSLFSSANCDISTPRMRVPTSMILFALRKISQSPIVHAPQSGTPAFPYLHTLFRPPAPRHFLISHYPTPHHFRISPRPTLRTSAPHPILHLTFPYPALPRPAPRSLIPLTPICAHPVPSTLARRLTPQPKSSPITSIEPLKNASDRSLASTQFDPDSISVQPTPARPQSMNFLRISCRFHKNSLLNPQSLRLPFLAMPRQNLQWKHDRTTPRKNLQGFMIRGEKLITRIAKERHRMTGDNAHTTRGAVPHPAKSAEVMLKNHRRCAGKKNGSALEQSANSAGRIK